MTKAMILFMTAATVFAGGASRSFSGVITDSMCIANHKMMRVSPDSKCVVDCVKSSKSVKYVLYDGKTSYVLSDQQTPAQFAGKKVTVTGVLVDRSIQVSKIEAAR
jgi:hypothetical protein